jgi:hydrogenase maturation protease
LPYLLACGYLPTYPNKKVLGLQKTIIIGVGNVLFKDEGVGIYAVQYLEKNYTFEPVIGIMDGGTLGFKLMGYFQDYENVFILDTVSIEDTVGTVYCLPSDVLLGLGAYRKTAHEVEIIEMLEICSLLENHANVTVVGIVPQDIESVENALTDEITTGFETLIAKTIEELEKIGIKSTKNSNNITLDSIVKNFFHNQKEQS